MPNPYRRELPPTPIVSGLAVAILCLLQSYVSMSRGPSRRASSECTFVDAADDDSESDAPVPFDVSFARCAAGHKVHGSSDDALFCFLAAPSAC